MFFLILVIFNIKAIDFSFSYTVNNAHYFDTANRTDTVSADIRKTFFINKAYYSSFGLSYSYGVLDYATLSNENSKDYNTFKFQAFDFLFEFGKIFRNNIVSSSLFLGHSTSSYINLANLNNSKKSKGPTYAANLMYGKVIKKNTEAKIGLIYRSLDQEIRYDFFGLMFLLRYRI